jgi:hypothetical protein
VPQVAFSSLILINIIQIIFNFPKVIFLLALDTKSGGGGFLRFLFADADVSAHPRYVF